MGMKSRTAVFLSEDVQRIDWEQGQPEQGTGTGAARFTDVIYIN